MALNTGAPKNVWKSSTKADILALWAQAAPLVDEVCRVARTHRAWRRAHPGHTGHVKMQRAVARVEVLHILSPLLRFLTAQAPSHWPTHDWGFKVLHTLGDARWSGNGGRSHATGANRHVSLTDRTAMAAFLGRILAAFALARHQPTTQASALWYDFALPPTRTVGFTPDTQGPWLRESIAVAGVNGMDAFAAATFHGLLQHPLALDRDAATAFFKAYRHVEEMARQAVPTHAPTLVEALLAHPTARALMAAQIVGGDSRSLADFQDAVRRRLSLAVSTDLRTKTDARRDTLAFERAIGDLLERLDRLGTPPARDVWWMWPMTGERRTTVWAWNLDSACVIAAIDDLQMHVAYTPPATYAATIRAHMAPVAA